MTMYYNKLPLVDQVIILFNFKEKRYSDVLPLMEQDIIQ